MNTLKAKMRNMETKAKRLRREGYVTGNLFGRELKGSIPLKIERNDVERLLNDCMVGSQIMLDVEGKAYDALIKEIDYDSMRKHVLEMDFQALVSDEKVHSVAEVIITNKEKVVEGVLEQLMKEVPYKAFPSDLVDKIVIDAGSLRLGDTIKVRDLDIAKNKNIDILINMDTPVVNVVIGRAGTVNETEDKTEEKTESK